MSKEKKKLKSNWIPFIILFFVMLILTSFKPFFLDDLAYADYWGVSSILEFIKVRFLTWTSRIIIDIVLVLLATKALWLWKLIDSIMYVVLGIGIYKVFVIKNQNNKVMISAIACLILLIPQRLFSEAGWMATSVNYLWPMAFGVLSLLPIRKCIYNQKQKWYETLIYMIFLIIAANNEQLAIVLFTAYFIFTIYFIAKRQMKLNIAIMLILSLASLLFILLCPGNSARANSELEKWFPDYHMYNIIDKIFLGIFVTLQYYINHFNMIYVLFTIIIAITIFKKYKNMFYRILSVIPVFMGTAFNIGENLLKEERGIFEGLAYLISKFRAENAFYLTFDNFDKIGTYIPVGLIIITLSCLIISIYLIFKENQNGILQLIILCAGICSKFIMGFIVTVFVSQNRTSFIFIICMIILTVMILDQKKEKELEKYSQALIIMSVFMTISNLCLILNLTA